MRIAVGWIGIALSVVLVSGCLDEDPRLETSSSALLHGNLTTARPEVAELSWPIPFMNKSHVCSATLISSRTFTTAAHCVDYLPIAYGGTLTFVSPYGVANIDAVFSQGGALGADDIAIGHLTADVSGITPMGISTTQPSNTTLTVMGYGCTESQDDGCDSTHRSYITYFYNGGTTDYSAPGDSGGPTFFGQLNDGGAMVRLTSGYYGFPYYNDLGADVVTYRNHILAMSNALTGTGVSYRSHVESQGWQPAVQNGATSGTTGQALRLEALQLWIAPFDIHTGWPYQPGICYQAYVQDYGWQPEKCNGDLAGTVGLGKRMEAIKVRYVPALGSCASYGGPPFIPCKVAHYSVYLQGFGWQGPYTDGQVAGTTGQSRRIEAIQVSVY